MKKFAVFGNPIAHSVSPTIHQMFAKSCNLDIQYDKLLAPLDGFESAVQQFFGDDQCMGCNVTVPFKQRAFAMADATSAAAAAAQAVNTLKRMPDGTLYGDNTDGVGLVADLRNNGVQLQGARVLLLGAGGAARGAIHPLLDAGVAKLLVANRTQSTVQTLVDGIADVRVEVAKQNDLPDTVDVIINSTSASLHGTIPEGVPESLFAGCQATYDMVYGTQPTVFLVHAKKHGCPVCLDGLGMLVEQAAAAFTIWTGEQPDTAPVIAHLRAQQG